MATTKNQGASAQKKLESAIRTVKIISTTALVIGILAILLAAYPLVKGMLSGPAPNFGHTLAGINSPLTPAQLAVINNASTSYFERAGEMYLNHSLPNVGGTTVARTNSLIINGKPSVVYLGAISCIYCGENRWAMALALGRFGKFGSIYTGYSSLGDGDVPTLYWTPALYNASSAVTFGGNYTSNYLNFLPIEYQSKITLGFQLQSIPYFQQQAVANGNGAYINATNQIAQLNTFQGTPYTIWGNSIVPGADAVAFTNGNTTLMNMTHAQIFAQLASPSNQFSWTEYGGADLYIAMVCASIKNSAPICSLPAIQGIERVSGY
ncbi:MAG: DUF929 family protein [Candidatus Micrarchaeota archaeon]|nr:DUF929 family protein [Candidatus Micrarchaeota archaeon]